MLLAIRKVQNVVTVIGVYHEAYIVLHLPNIAYLFPLLYIVQVMGRVPKTRILDIFQVEEIRCYCMCRNKNFRVP